MTAEARLLLEVRKELGPDYEDELVDSFVDRVGERLGSRHRHGKKPSSEGLRKQGLIPWLVIAVGVFFVVASLDSFWWFLWVVVCPLLLVGSGVLALTRRNG